MFYSLNLLPEYIKQTYKVDIFLCLWSVSEHFCSKSPNQWLIFTLKECTWASVMSMLFKAVNVWKHNTYVYIDNRVKYLTSEWLAMISVLANTKCHFGSHSSFIHFKKSPLLPYKRMIIVLLKSRLNWWKLCLKVECAHFEGQGLRRPGLRSAWKALRSAWRMLHLRRIS